MRTSPWVWSRGRQIEWTAWWCVWLQVLVVFIPSWTPSLSCGASTSDQFPGNKRIEKKRKLVLLFRFFVVEDKNKIECNNKKGTWAWNLLVIASSCFSSSLFTVHARSVLPVLAVKGTSVDESTIWHVIVNSCDAHLKLFYPHCTQKIFASFHMFIRIASTHKYRSGMYVYAWTFFVYFRHWVINVGIATRLWTGWSAVRI